MTTATDINRDVEGYSAVEVCELAGITYRQIDYWARNGIATPSLAVAWGSGSRRRYSPADTERIVMIARLLDAGLSLAKAMRLHVGDPCPTCDGSGRVEGYRAILPAEGDRDA